MNKRFFFVLLGILALVASAPAQNALPTPHFVPPDFSAGAEAYYQDMAIIETSCTDWKDVRALWVQLTEKGALISVITSPQRWLGWVPQDARNAVGNAHLDNAIGYVGVKSITYSAAEFRKSHSGQQLQAVANDADAALVDYLEFSKRTKTPEELQRIAEREREIEAIAPTIDQPPCVNMFEPQELPSGGKGPSTMGGANPLIARRTSPVGLISHTSFFPESQSGTGLWNWDNTVLFRYVLLYLDAINYWVNQSAKYGHTMTHIWHLYGPALASMQVPGEPTIIGEHAFIPIIINNVKPPTIWDILGGAIPNWNGTNGLRQGDAWGWYYNNKMRDEEGADQAIFGCIAWKGTPNEGIWPHAEVISWGNGDREGIYFALDVRYWQAGLDPFTLPNRNVCAHEIGHLWGSPDEYRTDNCGWNYRGADNINCQTTRSASSVGRPGYSLVGFDAMMVGNYLNGSSSVMPVHMGLINAANATPVRCFTTDPANGTMTLHVCDGSTHALSTRSFSGPTCIPLEWDHCNMLEVSLTRSISGSTWYFDHWEVTRRSGPLTTISAYANQLPSSAYASTQANPVTDIKAVYTNTPPDYNSVNTTITAWLAPASAVASPPPAIALRWRNKYDMSKVITKVEYNRAGTWVEVTPAVPILSAPINQFTGALIAALPLPGGGTTPVAANTLYQFRIRGYFNTLQGAASSTASVTTRPASPPDTVYCNDTYEPNATATPHTITSSGPGMLPYTINAACPLTPDAGFFYWYMVKNDYYRFTAINLSGYTSYGEQVTMILTVRPGSRFKPKFRAQHVGSTTFINAADIGADTYRLNLVDDGEYKISVEPQMSTFAGYRFVEPATGDFGFGEYTISVERTPHNPPLVSFCPACVRINLIRPINGLLFSKAPADLFDKGITKPMSSSFFDVFFDAPPGFVFDGWDVPKPDILEDPAANPTRFKLDPNMLDGEYDVSGRVKSIATGQSELVIVFPQGPDGPFEDRTLHATGSAVSLQANPSATYDFVGWSQDTVSTNNPIVVTMWHSKKIIATWKEKPCQPEPMTQWVHRLNLVNAKQGTVTLDYGMDPAAGDGLEAGQTGLPPIPPAGAFDIRWVNITGVQGCVTDLRAIQPNFVFQGRVQTGTGGTVPVVMSWGSPPTTPNASFKLTVSGDPTVIDMRTTSSYSFTAEGAYTLHLEVKTPDCPPKTKDPEVVIVPVRTDNTHFPCIELGLQFRDRKTDVLYPLYNPYQFHLFQKGPNGEWNPLRINEIVQLANMTLFRICSDPDDPRPGREIVIVNDDQEDPGKKKDTVTVNIPVPEPTGSGNPIRFVQQHSGDWELVSLPLDVKYTATDVIFSDPLTRLFGFDPPTGSYVNVPNMKFGDGYWLKTSEPATTYYGYERLLMQWDSLKGIGVPYGYGWNLIGAVSKPVAVTAIVVTPAGGLKSIFGYNPSLGYVVPTTCNPGQGFWVRVDPGTTLKMQTSFTGPPTVSEYSKTAERLNIVAKLSFENANHERQELQLTTSRIGAAEADNLLLPPLAIGGTLDVRTEAGTRFIPNGLTGIDIRGSGDVTLSFTPVFATQDRYQLLDGNMAVLAEMSGATPATLTLGIAGVQRLYLKTLNASPLSGFALDQNYPNPFTPGAVEFATIACSLSDPSHARLAVFDMMGRQVRLLMDQDLPAGTKHLRWDGRDERGYLVPPGTYVLRLQTAAGALSRPMTINGTK